MGTTTFSGPVKAGTIREGASANLGFVTMAQSAAWTQSTTGASTGIIIPANSQITAISLLVTTAPDTANLLVGTTDGGTELCTAVALGTSADVILNGSTSITDADTWKDVGTSDITVYTEASTGTSGVGIITVEYIQNNNLT